MYPNVVNVLRMFSLNVVSAASERANSCLRFIKYKLQSTIGEGKFKFLILLFENRDMDPEINDKAINTETKHPEEEL